MIILIQVLIILALVQINVILFDKARPVVKDATSEVKEAVEQRMHPKEADPEYQKWLTILNNIDVYDGSGKGQMKV